MKQQQQDDWREVVRRARAQVQADLDGRKLPPPEEILQQLQEGRDEQPLALR